MSNASVDSRSKRSAKAGTTERAVYAAYVVVEVEYEEEHEAEVEEAPTAEAEEPATTS
jgi:hypothetical protein